MESIYKEFENVKYNESNGYTVKNPFKDWNSFGSVG
jgi:hypothetical protein